MKLITPKLIITHLGPAHRDEFLAACIVRAWFPDADYIEMARRDPTPADLEDPSVWVIDVGGRHEPELSNFDHHQRGRDEAPLCSLSLILDHFGCLAEWRNIYGWLKITEQLDTQGPAATAKALGMSTEVFFKTLSPIEEAVLKMYGERTDATACEYDTVINLMEEIGRQQIEFVEAYAERLEWLHGHAEVQKVPNAEYHFIWIPRTEVQLVDPALAMRQFREETGKDIPVSVTPDPRGPGYGLFRYDDDPRVDFTRLEGNAGVEFVHKGGFYATTPTLDPKVIKELVAAGAVS